MKSVQDLMCFCKGEKTIGHGLMEKTRTRAQTLVHADLTNCSYKVVYLCISCYSCMWELSSCVCLCFRNFRHCQKSQPKFLKRKQVRKRAGSRGGRRSANLWPPIGGPIAKKKRKSLEDSINKKRKSVREEKNMRRRREERREDREQTG